VTCGLYQTLVNEFSRLLAGGRQNRFDIRHPDNLLLFEILQHTAQSGCADRCPDHKRVNADGNKVASRAESASASRANSVT
jgi:hypothetical protein